VAQAWGWLEAEDTEHVLGLLDRELGILFGLTR
jgi:hypothetical protein